MTQRCFPTLPCLKRHCLQTTKFLFAVAVGGWWCLSAGYAAGLPGFSACALASHTSADFDINSSSQGVKLCQQFSSGKHPALPQTLARGTLADSYGFVAHACTTFSAEGVPQFVVAELQPQDEAAEAEWDRVEALAHFAAARTFEQDGQLELALRRYQRALRYNPESQQAFEAALRIALRLGRLEEAARLIQVYGRPGSVDLPQILPLALFLIQRGNYAEAANMLELAAEAKDRVPLPGANLAIALEVGRLRFLTGDYEKAAKYFREVVAALRDGKDSQLSPDDRRSLLRQPVVTWRLMGTTFLEIKDLPLAEYCFREAFAVEGNQALLGFDLARVHKARGDYPAAEAALADYLKSPRDAEGIAPYRLLAELLREQGKEDELLGRLVDLHNAFPDLAPLSFALAEEYLRRGLIEESIALAEKLLEKRPTVEVWRHLIAAYRQREQWDKLLTLLGRMQREGIALESVEPNLREELAAEDVRTLLLETLERTPPKEASLQLGAKAAVALLCISGKDFLTARKLVTELWQSTSAHALEVLLELAFAYAEENQLDEACELLYMALDRSRDPSEQAVLKYYLAGFLELAGQTDEAVQVARQAVEAARENPRFRLRLAWILLHAKRYEEAAREYRSLLEQWEADHSSSEVRQVVKEAKLALSHVAVNRDRFEEAVEWLEQVLDEFPEDPTALNDLGYLWADKNMRLHRALRMITKALEAEPENAAYRDSLGWVLFRLGRYEQALEELEKAAAAEPDPVILDHLGEAYLAVGRIADARKAWERSVERFLETNEPEEAEKIREKLSKLPPE